MCYCLLPGEEGKEPWRESQGQFPWKYMDGVEKIV